MATDSLLKAFQQYSQSSPENDPLLRKAAEELERRRKEAEEEQSRRRFDGVSASIDSTAHDREPAAEPESSPSTLWGAAGGALDSFVGGAGREIGSYLYTQGRLNQSAGVNPFGLGGAAIALNLMPDAVVSGIGASVYEGGDQQAQRGREALVDSVPVVGGAISDVLSTPSSLASVLGGPWGAGIAGTTSFNQSFTESHLNGLSQEDSLLRAAGHGGIEAMFSAVPTGSLFNKVLPDSVTDPIKSYLKGKAANVAATAGLTVAGESVQEGATALGQLAWDKVLAEEAQSPELREFANQQLPKDATEVWDKVVKPAMAAGALGGGVTGGGMAALQDAQRAGEAVGRLNQAYPERRPITDAPPSNAINPTPVADPVQEDMFGQQDVDERATFEVQEAERRRQLEIEAAYNLREQELAGETRGQRREELRNSYVKRVDRARDEVFDLQDRVEAGDRSSATLNELTAAQSRLRTAEQRLENFDTSMQQVQQDTAQTEESPTSTTEPVQGSLLEEVGPQQLTAEQQAERQAARDQVAKQLSKEDNKVQDKAKSLRAKARRDRISELNAEATTEGLTGDAKTDYVTNAVLEWDGANPVENFIGAAQATPARKTPARKQPTRTAEPTPAPTATQPTEPAPVTSGDQLDALLRESGLESRPATEGGPARVTVQDVVADISSRMSSGDNRKAAAILTKGNVRLVEDTSAIPEDAVPTNAGAYYSLQTGMTYIAAGNLDSSKPLTGQILSRAAHEFKHAGDLSGNTDLRAGALSSFVGAEQNERINKQIRAEAERNPRGPAARALARANSATEEGAVRELELPAYFIEEMRNDRDRTAAVGKIARDIVSAVRTGAKQILPGDYEVNLNDVGYLSEQLLTQAAVSRQSNAPTAENLQTAGIARMREGLNTIQGPLSARYAEAKERGWTYRSMDGNEKFVVSDANSKMNRSTVRLLKGAPDDEGYAAKELINHPELFSDYPQLGDLPIVINRELPDGEAAYYSASEDNPSHIVVNGGSVDRAVRSPRAMDELKGLILHELQHAVQDIENSARGGNPKMFRTPEDRARIFRVKAADRRFQMARNEALDMILDPTSDIPEANRQMLTDIFVNFADTNVTTQEVIAELLEEMALIPEGTQGRAALQRVVDVYNEADSDVTANRAMQLRTLRDYNDLLGEREAYFTQETADLDQDQLPRNPEDPNDPMGFSGVRFSTARDYDGRTIIRQNNQQVDSSEFTVGTFEPEVTGLASEAEGVSLPPQPERRKRSFQEALGEVTRRAILPDGGVPDSIAMAVTGAFNSQSAYALTSGVLTRDLTHAVDDVAKSRGVDRQEVLDQLDKELARIDEIGDRATREAELDKLNTLMPVSDARLTKGGTSVAGAMRAIRDAKRQFTRETIANRRADPTPLTEKELAIFRKMIENDERYTTRAYLATYRSELGKEYGENLLKRAYDDPTSEEARTLRDAIDYLIENELLVPPYEDIMALPIESVRRMYGNWGLEGNPSSFKGRSGKQLMAQRLEQHMGATREAMEAKALDIVRDMLLGDESSPRRRSVRALTRPDRTIVEARREVPAPLRKLLGEVTDPILRETLTLHRMGNFVAKSRMMNDLHRAGDGAFWSDAPTDTHTVRIANDEAYGPLAGKYVTRDVEFSLGNVINAQQEMDVALGEAMHNPALFSQMVAGGFGKAMRGVVGAQKYAQVVLSPANMGLNLGGSPLMALANGLGPISIGRGIRGATAATGADISLDLLMQHNPALNLLFGADPVKTAAELVEAGAMDTASVRILQSDFTELVKDEIRAQIEAGQNVSFTRATWRSLRKHGKNFKQATAAAYALTDVWVKAATYYDRKDFWTKMNQYENMNLSELEIRRRSGWDASTTNISYDRAIPLFRALEQNTPIAVFMTYFSEAMIRVPIMNMVQASRDATLARNATSPEGRRLAGMHAGKRAFGTLSATAGMIAATMMLLGSEDEEEKKIRALDPEFYRDTILIPIGKDKDGNTRYYPLNRIDPLGPLNEFMVAILAADEDSKGEAAWNAVVEMFVPSKGFMAMLQVFGDIGAKAFGQEWMEQDRVKNTWIEQTYPEFYNAVTQYANDGDIPENLMAVIDAFTPSGARPLPYIEDQTRDALGFRPYVREPEKSLTFGIYGYNKTKGNLRKDFLNYLDQKPSQDQIMRRMNNVLDQEREAFEELQGKYEGFLVATNEKENRKYTKSEARKIFVNARENRLVHNLATNRFKSSIVDRRALHRWYTDQRKRGDVDRKELDKTYNMIKRAYADVMEERSRTDG